MQNAVRAVLLDGVCEAQGSVRLGPLTLATAQRVVTGPVKVAIRPEAWAVHDGHGQGLLGTVSKAAYLGSFQELTVDTSLGEIFVVSSDAQGSWGRGDAVTLQLAERGVSVVAV